MKKYTELQIKNNCFEGLKYYQPTCYHDFRGYYWTVYNNKQDNEVYNHDKITVSRKNTLRGIHGDAVTTKLITCVYGEVYCVVVVKMLVCYINGHTKVNILILQINLQLNGIV